MVFINLRILYKRNCNLCKKGIVSIYHKDVLFPVYCNKCWWSDKWDSLSYAEDFDFNKPFLQQFFELHKKVPRQATTVRNSIGCNYCNATVSSKNCYLNFGSYMSENCLYCSYPIMSRDSVDSDWGMNMDHAYGSYNSDAIFNAKHVYFSEECIDCSFLFDCRGCTECFGCVNLRHKKYHLFNQRLTKEAYREQMKYWDLGSYSKIQEAQRKFKEFFMSLPHRFAWMRNSFDVTGDNIKNSKNCQSCFIVLNGVENCRYVLSGGLLLKDSYDVTVGGEKSQLLYETTGSLNSERVFFSRGSNNSHNVEYSDSPYGSHHVFGCVFPRNKSYCILNKQYTKEKYETLVPKIIEHMNSMPYIDKKERIYKYGEFLPPEMSPWAYNESWSQEWFPLDKGEVVNKGYKWRDQEIRDYKETISHNNLPDHIKNTPDSIVNEVISCEHGGNCNELCTEFFRIIPEELKFYRQMNIALPRLCSNCRYFQRIKWRNPPRLWDRQCQCAGIKSDNEKYANTTEHFHKAGHCPNLFKTSYDPDREEVIYCQQCYNSEFI